ncbi:MAG: LysM peptidoglycan-binding domain-containing protein [Candidatus Levybacteria bacterium]|nr:LysM peptidoglycan-binding domain-containing protein [Candidatus Levybacteria bacterium]
MAVRKKREGGQQIKPQNSGIFDFFRPGESYTSLVLGIVVVIIAAVLILSFVKGKKIGTDSETQTDVSSDESMVDGVQTIDGEKIYKVQAGDDLWKIAEKVYKDGFKWVEIAKLNNLTDPSLIHVDNVLKLPNIEQKNPEMEAVVVSPSPDAKIDTEVMAADAKITGVTYKVEKGDYLWEISVRAYGDGFKWVEIAKANNITNPDIIFTGTELKLPR